MKIVFFFFLVLLSGNHFGNVLFLNLIAQLVNFNVKMLNWSFITLNCLYNSFLI